MRTISMVVRNEKKLNKVIHERKIKEWVGIGWIDLTEPSFNDLKKYPIAMM